VPTGSASQSIGNDADDVLTPKAAENPVVAALKARGLYKTPLGSGKHDITCPWVHEHTDELDTGAAYFEPDELYPVGGFCCQHSHRDKYHIRELLEVLGVSILLQQPAMLDDLGTKVPYDPSRPALPDTGDDDDAP
jgi:hypothetical protein